LYTSYRCATLLPAGAERVKIMVVTWIPGTENEADMFTKNLDGPVFKRYAKPFLGKGAFGKDTQNLNS
jgi:hypothetical protein